MSKRNRGQRALYEAMSRSRPKPKRGKVLENLRPQMEKIKLPSLPKVKLPSLERIKQAVTPKEKPKAQVEPAERPQEEQRAQRPAAVPVAPPRPAESPQPEPAQAPAQTWLHPKTFCINDGRIEISIPWQWGIVIALGVIVVLLAAFRFGQMDEKARSAALQPPRRTETAESSAGAENAAVSRNEPTTPSRSSVESSAATTASVQGDHVIVLAQYALRTHLVPVQAYFAEHGISTEIISVARLREYFAENNMNTSILPESDGFMLVTGKLYENPNEPGSDGYALKQKIAEIGANYKAKTGYESFAPNYFSDAYGMKIR